MIVDLFLSKESVPIEDYNVLGLSSLQIAIKLEEVDCNTDLGLDNSRQFELVYKKNKYSKHSNSKFYQTLSTIG